MTTRGAKWTKQEMAEHILGFVFGHLLFLFHILEKNNKEMHLTFCFHRGLSPPDVRIVRILFFNSVETIFLHC